MGHRRRAFSQDVTKFVQKTGVAPDLVLRKFALDAYGTALFLSPVREGRFRGNWRLGVNTIDRTTDLGQPASKGKGPSETAPATSAELSVVAGKVEDAKFGDTILITNNLPYARRLEMGYSKQAPKGVLRRSLDYTLQDFRKIVAAVRKAL